MKVSRGHHQPDQSSEHPRWRVWWGHRCGDRPADGARLWGGLGGWGRLRFTIELMNALRSRGVKAISTGDGELVLTPRGEGAAGSGRKQGAALPAQRRHGLRPGLAIAREHDAITDFQSIMFDLCSVSRLGVTAALALENVVDEAVEKGRSVSVLGDHGTTRQRLESPGCSSCWMPPTPRSAATRPCSPLPPSSRCCWPRLWGSPISLAPCWEPCCCW